MNKSLRSALGAAVGLVAATVFSSCAYDPYYSSTLVGGSYSTGYGGGYGGGVSSTSLFVSTGDPRWGYDPSCYSYYDYNRRCYYDPYLNGYYPVGYRPPVVYGVSHPYGWRPGSAYCRPPGGVSNVTITNYRSRQANYRARGYSSGVQASKNPYNSGRSYAKHPAQGSSYGSGNYQSGSSSRSRSSAFPSYPSLQGRKIPAQPASRYPSRYNTPINAGQQRVSGSPQGATRSPQRQIRQIASPDVSRGNQSQGSPSRSRRSQASDDDSRDGRSGSRSRRIN